MAENPSHLQNTTILTTAILITKLSKMFSNVLFTDIYIAYVKIMQLANLHVTCEPPYNLLKHIPQETTICYHRHRWIVDQKRRVMLLYFIQRQEQCRILYSDRRIEISTNVLVCRAIICKVYHEAMFNSTYCNTS